MLKKRPSPFPTVALVLGEHQLLGRSRSSRPSPIPADALVLGPSSSRLVLTHLVQTLALIESLSSPPSSLSWTPVGICADCRQPASFPDWTPVLKKRPFLSRADALVAGPLIKPSRADASPWTPRACQRPFPFAHCMCPCCWAYVKSSLADASCLDARAE